MATDPRKVANPKTVNEILIDRSIRHGIYLVRLSGGEANWVRKQMPAIRKAVGQAIAPYLADLEPGEVLSITDQTLINEAAQRGAEVVAQELERIQGKALTRLGDIAAAEAEFEARLFEKAIPIERNFSRPSDQFLRSFMRNEPISGKTMDRWFSSMTAQVRVGINDEIRQGMLEGESINKILRRVRGRRENGFQDGVIGRLGGNAEAIVRSGVMKASNRARQEFHMMNEDVLRGHEWVLTLDSRTCPICVAGASENPYPVSSPPDLPAHPQCRCVSVALTKSWEELGFDIDEMEPGMRRAMDGEVPDTMTYEEWFDQQDAELQKEILGPSHYKAYKNGRSVTAFADNGETLTVKELRSMEPDLFGGGNLDPDGNPRPRFLHPEVRAGSANMVNLSDFARKSRNHVLGKGRADGFEHAIIASGDEIYKEVTSRSSKFVRFDDETLRAFDDPSNNFSIHHNHPDNVPLSPNDYAMTAREGIKDVYAYTQEGNIFHGRILVNASRLRTQYSSLESDLVRHMKRFERSQGLGVNNTQANFVYQHLTLLKLQDEGIIEYSYHLSAAERELLDQMDEIGLFDELLSVLR